MTVIADARNSVPLPSVRPGDRFDLQVAGEGKFVLTRLESNAAHGAKVKIEKRDGFSVGVLDRPINDQNLAEALNEFP